MMEAKKNMKQAIIEQLNIWTAYFFVSHPQAHGGILIFISFVLYQTPSLKLVILHYSSRSKEVLFRVLIGMKSFSIIILKF